jgi:tetrahydromethanopterin S-methyltransferase subunit A
MNGVDGNHRVVGAKSAIPFIENLPLEAVERFQRQVEIVDLIGVNDGGRVAGVIDDCLGMNPGSFGEPMIIEPVSRDRIVEVFHSEHALHSKVDVDLYGVVSPAPEVR